MLLEQARLGGRVVPREAPLLVPVPVLVVGRCARLHFILQRALRVILRELVNDVLLLLRVLHVVLAYLLLRPLVLAEPVLGARVLRKVHGRVRVGLQFRLGLLVRRGSDHGGRGLREELAADWVVGHREWALVAEIIHELAINL